MSNNDIHNKRIENIYNLLDLTNRNIEKIKEMLRNLDRDEHKDQYREVPGITGTFDGVYMLPEKGDKIEVPANYSAKSRLVFGDTLKLIEEDGKQVFKQIEKIERKKVEGVLMKKEGKWYIISDSGTYKISDIAAEYQHAELSDEAVAYVPANNLNVPYAALDRVMKKSVGELVVAPKPVRPAVTVAPKPAEVKRVEVKQAATKVSVQASPKKTPTVSAPSAPAVVHKPYKRPAEKVEIIATPAKEVKKEFVQDIVNPTKAASLDEDDLR